MKSALSWLCVSLVVTVSAYSQQVASVDAGASRADIARLLDLVHVGDQMALMRDGLVTNMKQSAETTFKKKVPDATAEQVAVLNGMVDDAFQDFPIDELLDAIVPIYQKHLSPADVNKMIEFYSTPTGQKVIAEMPAMMKEAMQAGAELTRARMDTITQRIDKRMKQLEELQQHSSKSP